MNPLIAIGIAGVIVLVIFLTSPSYWEAYPFAALFLFGIIMACGGVFALLPMEFARKTENFLLGPRRTHWKLDQRITVANGGFWSYLFHLPKNGWLGVRCNSDVPVSVEIVSEADAAGADTVSSRKPEEMRKNVQNASVFYRAAHEGNWVLVIRNTSTKPANVEVKVADWVSTWS